MLQSTRNISLKVGFDMKIRNNRWISFEKFFVILALIVGICVSIAAGLIVASGQVASLSEYSVVFGIAIIIIGILISFASVAIMMIYLTLAQDVRDIRNLMLMKEEAGAAKASPKASEGK